jgi:LuxR family maltose regulon positive regulatory protein
LSREEVATLHSKASAWLAGNGFIEEALGHALAAGAVTEAARLVEENRHDALNREDWATLERWLNLLPEETIQGRPALLLARAWILDIRGQLGGIPHLLGEAEGRLSADDAACAGSELRILGGEIDALWSIILQWSDECQQSLERALRALDCIPVAHSFARSMAVLFLALAYQSTGQAKTALSTLGEFLTAPDAQHDTLIARMLYGQVFVHLLEGNLYQAAQTIDQLQNMLSNAELPIVNVVVHWLSGRIHYEWNNLEAASQHLNLVFELRYGGAYIMVHDSMLNLALTYQAQGMQEKADETLAALRGFAQESGNLARLQEIGSVEARLSVLQGNLQPAAHWAETVRLQKPKTTFFFLEFPWATKARVLIAIGTEASLREATQSLEDLLVYAESLHITYRQIGLLAHLALAYEKQGRRDDALEALSRSVRLAQPGGFIRTFVDLDPAVARLLYQLSQRGVAPEYIGRILAAFPETPDTGEAGQRWSGKVPQAPLIEPLTERELEVLVLLEEGLSNKEIAKELIITTRTVKKHTSNIYHKLGVHNRGKAVTKGKALGILSSD